MSSEPTGATGPVASDREGRWLGLRPVTLVMLVAIGVLLIPLSVLSQPADSISPGGVLAQMRAEEGLSQANLGEIDPTSETMRLATLGLKNVAVTLLWDRANHYKKVEDWTNLSATLEQMTKLQPNFYSVWDFQAHNLSYNISVEFDDYHDRYAWVIKGIEFLRDGIFLNTREPRLLGRMGWFIGQKIGKADEKLQYRRLFKQDEDFHERDRPGRTLPERDNWLVGREKYIAGQELVDSGAPLKTTPLIYHSEPMMTAINYARALQDEGVFGEQGRNAWTLAGDEMRRYSVRDIPTSWDLPIRLGLEEEMREQAERLEEQLEEMMPGSFKALGKRLRDELPEEERVALETSITLRTDEQQRLGFEAEQKTQVNWPMVAREAPADIRDEAIRLARDFQEAFETAQIIRRYRDIVNFDYWRASCEAGITEDLLVAREATWRAQQDFENARLQPAKEAFEEAFAAWRRVLDEYEVLRNDDLTVDDIKEVVGRYRQVLDQLDETFPSPFILQDVLDY
ncbi:MAG: hypothetical protein ISQ07_04650 [Pirellulales bacterium]|jgi:hypothetical protein|nr:hypothetical protein [Pirellulales bacterium]